LARAKTVIQKTLKALTQYHNRSLESCNINRACVTHVLCIFIRVMGIP